jgi:hypothetical protein
MITGATGMVRGCALRICLGYRVFNNYKRFSIKLKWRNIQKPGPDPRLYPNW